MCFEFSYRLWISNLDYGSETCICIWMWIVGDNMKMELDSVVGIRFVEFNVGCGFRTWDCGTRYGSAYGLCKRN